MLWISLLSLASIICVVESTVSVDTKLGVINGKIVGHTFRGRQYETRQFLGIPYAKPPTGQLRFQKPQSYGAFTEPFDAVEFGNACSQIDIMSLGILSYDEDCLSLNVFVPITVEETGGQLAVMIFIHGGGFSMGASSLIPGHVLSAYGNIILVSINYRLGLFGFANTGDDKARGNMGLWDQRLAIQWVNDNIEAFGGDPSKITIFGESAGSMSAIMQGMYPPNKGLFQNIIAESGTPTVPFGLRDNNVASLTLLAELCGCLTDDIDHVYTCLYEKDAKTIISKLNDVIQADKETIMKIQFTVTMDGEYFKRKSLETLALEKDQSTEEIEFLKSLNVIVGINSAEGGMWFPIFFQGDIENLSISRENMKTIHVPRALMMENFGESMPSELLKSIVTTEYTNWQDPSEARDSYVKLMGDIFFKVPGYEYSLLLANDSSPNVWLYNFAAQLETHVIVTPSWLNGANHVDELIPVFGYGITEYGILADVANYTPPEWELDLSESMMTYWSNFAKYGNPNGKRGTVDWPRFDTDSQQHLNINKENTVGQYLYLKEVEFWRKIVPLVRRSVDVSHGGDSPFTKTTTDTCDREGGCR